MAELGKLLQVSLLGHLIERLPERIVSTEETLCYISCIYQVLTADAPAEIVRTLRIYGILIGSQRPFTQLLALLALSSSIIRKSEPWRGATINMAGAAITITVLTLAAVHTLGIPVDMPTALLLCVVAAVGACGASGVPGGSLLLIPLACNMFGIPNDVAMQVVAVGFIIGVLQDSCETALNSSTDALFTAAACMAEDDQLAKNALRG